jgi:hypothetical protein
MLTDEQIIRKYGQPGDPLNITILTLPYPMRIAWDTSKSVTRIQCHKLINEDLNNVFSGLLDYYGYEKIKELGIDLFGGCLNVRLMRGSKKRWSRHSWGIAIDLDPSRNGLKTKWPDAQFSKKEYEPMIKIFYDNGFVSYGKERGFDAMHFEINK